MSMVSWKSLFCITAINLFAQISVYCFPAGERNSHNEDQENWSGLYDLLEISSFDPSWYDETQSAHKGGENAQVGSANQGTMEDGRKKSMKRKSRKTPEDREKQRVYRQTLKENRETDPIAQQKHRDRMNEFNRKWKANRTSKMTESEKEAFIVRKKQAKARYNESHRTRCGGYSSSKQQRLAKIRRMKAEGTANEADLKFLHEYQHDAKLRRRKERAAQKGHN
ncbi:uncharacterized protein FA14DRAFT_152121 [Meira miltonrushii]|uniref:Uncharacterized protein n=1 Tax=Meira miltonrushii TaxID=1280837 RepID=A0A316VK55_9BASI|nr:uncharacterized protein FA14DRAFT_152121 [Meira miltonrushii]PWN36693.1 hypothetical protein FA14DRAFT_152121 [Meira miltonrushii]